MSSPNSVVRSQTAPSGRRRGRSRRSASARRSRRRVVQRALGGPAVEPHPRSARASPVAVEHQLQPAPRSPSRSAGRSPSADLLRQLARRSRPRSRPRATRSPLIRAAIERRKSDWRALVVDVVLALDTVAGELEHPRERVAVGGVPPAGGGQRAGRVGADELHQDRARPCRRRRARSAPLPANRGERGPEPRLGQEQVEEAGAGDLDPLQRDRPAANRRRSPSRPATSRGGS